MLQPSALPVSPASGSFMPVLEHVPPASGHAIPVIVDSPHSGRHMPDDWRLSCDPFYVRQRTEDSFVDTLCDGLPDIGAHFLAARTARAYLDVNRPLTSLMPTDLKPPLCVLKPSGARDVNARNGRGLYWRVCLIDGRKIPIVSESDIPDEAALLSRIKTIWSPYHNRLRHIMRGLHAVHGIAIHFNLHAFYPTGQKSQPEVVIGDLHGRSCAPWLTRLAASHFAAHGYHTSVNMPYPGGEILRKASAPHLGYHSLQIELRKDLYMDAARVMPHQGFWRLRRVLHDLVAASARAGARFSQSIVP